MGNYRILKLKSGEEIIAKLTGKIGNDITLEFPMVFKSMHIADPRTGTQKELTVLRDWIANTKETEIKIPNDYILCFTEPSKQSTELYELEKRKKIESPKEKKIQKISPTEPPSQRTEIDRVDDDTSMEDILNKIFKGHDPSEMMPETPMFPPKWIHLSADMLRDMMENLEDYEVEWTLPPEEISEDETTEDDRYHPDYGNRWTDWNINPNEY